MPQDPEVPSSKTLDAGWPTTSEDETQAFDAAALLRESARLSQRELAMEVDGDAEHRWRLDREDALDFEDHATSDGEPETPGDRPTKPPPMPGPEYVAHAMGVTATPPPAPSFDYDGDIEPAPHTRPFPGLEDEPRYGERPRSSGQLRSTPTSSSGPSTRRGIESVVPPPVGPEGRLRQAEERLALGEYGPALMLAEGVLDEMPGHLGAQRCVEACRAELRTSYLMRMGDGSSIPRVVTPPGEIRWLDLDHRAGFLLSRVDGMSSIDDILDMSGMSELDALRLLFELMQAGVIEIVPPGRRTFGGRGSGRT